MSIMDHDPKYAKLRAWRETIYREQRIAEYRHFIDRSMFPPAALSRWVAQDYLLRGNLFELLPMCFPLMNMFPRKQFDFGETVKWKPIISYVREREQ